MIPCLKLPREYHITLKQSTEEVSVEETGERGINKSNLVFRYECLYPHKSREPILLHPPTSLKKT